MVEKSFVPKMLLNPFTLTFKQGQAGIEDDFQVEYFYNSLTIVRFVCFFSLIVYGTFAFLDAYLVPEQKQIFWIFRFAIFAPFCLTVFALSYTKIFRKLMAPAIFCWELLAGFGIILMIMLAPPPACFFYYAGLILVFMIGYTLCRQRFIWATAAGWLLVVMYEFTAVSFRQTPVSIMINNNFFFISANIIGMAACYAIERRSRYEFFLRQLLTSEQLKVSQARDNLAAKVAERTAKLETANSRLTQEMARRQQVQAQLLRHQKMESIGLVAGGVAHDLNNILSGVITYPELLLLDLPADSKLRPPIETILQSGKQAAAVVADLLTVTRGVANKQDIISLNELIESYLKSPEFEKTAALYPAIKLKTRLKSDLPPCLCSTVHINKVLMNLVNNAFEAIHDSGRIIIATKIIELSKPDAESMLLKPGRYCAFTVQDTGPGIAAADLPHIFEPFYSKKVLGMSGTGLGLTVVWNTMQEHGGTIYVESDVEGTIFTSLLPISDAKKKKKKSKEDDFKNLQGSGMVLVVDDEAVQRDLGREIFTRLGYGVETVNSGEKAVSYLQNHKIDLVILDMLLGDGMNGYQTYQKIIKIRPAQKVIIASGYSADNEVKAALALGVERFIKKPYSLQEIGRLVKDIIT